MKYVLYGAEVEVEGVDFSGVANFVDKQDEEVKRRRRRRRRGSGSGRR